MNYDCENCPFEKLCSTNDRNYLNNNCLFYRDLELWMFDDDDVNFYIQEENNWFEMSYHKYKKNSDDSRWNIELTEWEKYEKEDGWELYLEDENNNIEAVEVF